MLDFSSEFDDAEFDTLEDYSVVTPNSPITSSPKKYVRGSKTNINWIRVYEYEPEPGQQDSTIGLQKCLQFIKPFGDFAFYQSQRNYGKVLKCAGHHNCDTKYRYGFSKKVSIFFVDSNNEQ
jgi:hypothetical protein